MSDRAEQKTPASEAELRRTRARFLSAREQVAAQSLRDYVRVREMRRWPGASPGGG